MSRPLRLRHKGGYRPPDFMPALAAQTTRRRAYTASNLVIRTNPNGSTLSFTYDGLNRLLTKTRSTGGTFFYSYDSGASRKGRLVSVVKQNSSDGTYYDAYDALGRVSASRQITDGNSYSFSNYGYDLAGNLTSETYPSGRVISQSYDAAGRLAQVSGRRTGDADKTYANAFAYTASGAVSAMGLSVSKNLAAMSEQTTYNGRLQPTKIELRKASDNSVILGLDYSYGVRNAQGVLDATTNNGNVEGQVVRQGASPSGSVIASQSYKYDELNRLQMAGESGSWSQTYGYDRYGNRWVGQSLVYPLDQQTPTGSGWFDTTSNRIVMAGFGYDASGNLTSDPTTTANLSIGYDAENHQTSYPRGGVTNSYVYDGDGQRVKKVDRTGTTLYVYDAMGRLMGEYTSGGTAGGGTSYMTADMLGSVRVVTRGDGSVKGRYDYLPYGEEVGAGMGQRTAAMGYSPSQSQDNTRQKFTSKERDTESGLDYFLARYYSSAQGRFTSAQES